MKQTDEFKIPPDDFPDETEVGKTVPQLQKPIVAEFTRGSAEVRDPVPLSLVKAMADIATWVWKARSRMVDASSGGIRDEMKRTFGDMERIYKVLRKLGVVVKDHTGDAFDYGMPMKVVTAKPMPGINKEVITETLKPTIYWGQNHPARRCRNRDTANA